MTRKHNKSILCLVTLLFLSVASLYATNTKKILINEILASNSNGIQDKDGNRSDWIELYNPGSTSINLSDWSISDSESKPRKWVFPSISIAPGEYLLVFASDKNLNNPSGELHTNFNLSASGEYLGLFEPDGTISDEYSPEYPAQIADVSYGYYEGELISFNLPSPGKENTLVGQAQNPKFSVERGFYEEPFTVSLSVVDPNTQIYYTTDGTRPTNKSTRYTTPITITTTTPLSAISISGENSSRIVSHSYFFINDIIRQTQTPTGYPDRWGIMGNGNGGSFSYSDYPPGSRAPAHYAMNQAVSNDPAYKEYIEEAFLSLPSVSFVTNSGYFFSDSEDENEGGIYIHTGVKQTSLGRGWERPISMEYYEPTTEKQFQINCGVRIHGAASRQPEKCTKHSFRVSFRKEYGSGKLNYDLFEKKSAVSKFDHLIFRAGFGCSWMHHEAAQRESSLYITDAFLKHLQRDMGHLSAHNRFVHLFINGIYWGIYDISERISNNMMETYFGGEDVDYDIINHDIDDPVKDGGGPADGERIAFDRMVTLASNGDYNTLKKENLLNMENYIDFVLINVYVGNRDWGNNNWYATRNRVNPDEGFIFYCWDGENSLRDKNDAIISTKWRFKSTPLRRILFGNSDSSTNGGLSQNTEFRLLFADRVQKHFFNGGTLTSDRMTEIFESLAEQLNYPIILESARWGNNRKDYMTSKEGNAKLYTRNDHWLPLKNKTVSDYFPARNSIVYNQLKAVKLTGDLTAPNFSSTGGKIESPISLTMTKSSGDIYYTTDGSDPRIQGTGDLSSLATKYSSAVVIDKSCTVKARIKSGSTWSPLNEVSFERKDPTSLPGTDQASSIEAYYNQGVLYLNLPTSGELSLSLYSVDGKLLQEVNTYGQSGRNTLPLSNLSEGIYIYRLSLNGERVSGKLVSSEW